MDMIQLADPIVITGQRPLTEDDRETLAQAKGTMGTEAPKVARLTQRHHRLARTLAEGTSPGQAAIMCDFSPSRVSILQNDPSFAALVAHYAAQVDATYLSLHDRLSELASDAAALLRDKMEDSPEAFEVGELMGIVKLGADRTGHGPSSTTKHEIGDKLSERINAARARRAAAATLPPDVIDGEIVE